MSAHRADVPTDGADPQALQQQLAERLRTDLRAAETRAAEAQQYLNAVRLAISLAEALDEANAELAHLRETVTRLGDADRTLRMMRAPSRVRER